MAKSEKFRPKPEGSGTLEAAFEGLDGSGAAGFHVICDTRGLSAPGGGFVTEAYEKGGKFLPVALVKALNLLFDLKNAHGAKVVLAGGGVNGVEAGGPPQPSQARSFSMMESRVGR